jgi:predicted Zn finger-like uncharacterized protein
MRLICPSCGAQYEVDESVIPDGGRDVQCSNCGHAWFQLSAKQLEAEADEAERKAAADDVATTEEASSRAADTSPPAAPDETPPEPSGAWAERTEEPGEPADQPGPPERTRRTLDDAVRNVLREEAQRETRARIAEGTSVETQPDLGLAAAIGATAATTGGRTAEPQDQDAKSRGEAHDFDDDALISRASRRELLPDIEEINSTLRATSERGNEAAALDAPETLARRRSGFRMGFSTAILVAAILLGLYVLAPMLAESVPALEPVLTAYVTAVDAGRTWLDDRMRSLTASLQSGSAN